MNGVVDLEELKLDGELDGDPFISTLSAKRTLEGLFFNRCFFAADNMADLRAELSKGGCVTVRVTLSLQDLTSCIT